MVFKSSIGQDSHRFEEISNKKFIIGGIHFPKIKLSLSGNSDADVVLHAITNAISGITGVNILGKIADDMCKQGITDSTEYLKEALKHLYKSYKISHLSISIECSQPKITPLVDSMRMNIAKLLSVEYKDVCITATSGEGLTDYGRGLGIQAFAILSVYKS